MKQIHRNLVFGSILIGSVLAAGSVTIPNSFTANTTAKAAEVNANFTAVKGGINGNASDIATNASGIATNESNITTNANDIATNANGIATNASSIAGGIVEIATKVTDVTAENGIVTARTENNITIGLQGGVLPIHGTAFSVSDGRSDKCELFRYEGSVRFSTTSTLSTCKAYASVPIPARAKPTQLVCRYFHHDGAAHTVLTMYEQHSVRHLGVPPYYTMTNNDVATIDDSTTDTHVQVGIADVTLPQVFVTNGPSTYTVEWAPSATNSAGTNEKLYDCLVYYDY